MDTCITVWHFPNHPRWYDEGIRRTLAEVRAAGFSHVNWNPDAGYSYLYAPSEMAFIASLLDEAGLDLVRNRLSFCREVGAPTLVMHVDLDDIALRDPGEHAAFFARLHRSFDDLADDCLRAGVRIAVENLTAAPMERTLEMFAALFDRHPADVVGLCYDCGHAELSEPGGFRLLDTHGDRLIATHLHDNHSVRDDHLLPGDGRIDWERLIGLIAATPYAPPLTFETPHSLYGRGYSLGEPAFYARAHDRIVALETRLQEHRSRALPGG